MKASAAWFVFAMLTLLAIIIRHDIKQESKS